MGQAGPLSLNYVVQACVKGVSVFEPLMLRDLRQPDLLRAWAGAPAAACRRHVMRSQETSSAPQSRLKPRTCR